MTATVFLRDTLPTSGTALTTSNSGSPAPTQVTVGSGTIKSASWGLGSGLLCAEATSASGSTTIIRVPAGSANKTGNAHGYFTVPTPSSGTVIVFATLRGSGGPSYKFGLDSSRKLAVYDSVGAEISGWTGGVPRSPQAVPNAPFRVEALHVVGAGTTDGQLKVNFYAAAATTPTNLVQFTTTTANLGTTAIAAADLFFSVAPTAIYVVDARGFIINDGATTEFGIDTVAEGSGGTNVAPVATMMARPVPQAAGTVSGTGTITDDSKVSSASVTIVSGPDSPTVSVGTSGLNTASCTVTWSFTGAPGRYVVRLAGVDDASAASNNSDVIIDIYPASAADVKPAARLSGGTTTFGSPANAVAGVTDGLSTTGQTSGDAPVHVQELWQYCAFPPGALKMRVKGLQTPSTPPITVQATVYKEDGVTQLYQTSFAAPTSEQDTFVTLDSTAMTALGTVLTNRRALQLLLDYNQ